MQQPSKYSAARLPGKEHVPLYPKGFIALRIVQLVLGVIILGMTGFLVAIIPFSSVILMLFTALATMIATIYYMCVQPVCAAGHSSRSC